MGWHGCPGFPGAVCEEGQPSHLSAHRNHTQNLFKVPVSTTRKSTGETAEWLQESAFSFAF